MIPIPLILTAARDLIPWRLVAAVATALALFAYGHHRGAASVQAEWDKAKLAQATERADAMVEAMKVQQSLQALIDQTKKDRTNEIARIDRLHAAALDSLRSRPERPAAAGLPTTAGLVAPARGCTGADLFREDAAVVVGIARDADLVRAALNECRAGYQAAQGFPSREVKDGAP